MQIEGFYNSRGITEATNNTAVVAQTATVQGNKEQDGEPLFSRDSLKLSSVARVLLDQLRAKEHGVVESPQAVQAPASVEADMDKSLQNQSLHSQTLRDKPYTGSSVQQDTEIQSMSSHIEALQQQAKQVASSSLTPYEKQARFAMLQTQMAQAHTVLMRA